VRDGEVLHLVPGTVDWPEPDYDDLADAIAQGTGRTGRLWGPRQSRLAAAAVALSLALLAVLRAGSGLRVGQLVTAETTGGAVRGFLVTADRLRPISALQFDIQLAHRGTAAAYPGAEPVGVPLGLAAAAEARMETAATPQPGAATAVLRRGGTPSA
jgi:hypothetical protein